MIVEDSDATASNVDIRIKSNDLHNNDIPPGEGEPSGLFLHNSDGVLIEGNTANANASLGIHLDPNSDFNVLHDNTASGNPAQDFKDDGTNNCGPGNSFSVPNCP